LEKKIESEMMTVKKNVSSNKRLAIAALRRRKQCDKQLLQLDGVLSTLQHQKESLENASVNAEVLNVLSNSAKALKGAHNHMDIDQVHDLMEDIAEQQEVANEIANAISNPVGLQMEDEDDLLAELSALEEEELNEKLLHVGPAPVDTSRLPSVPTTEFPSAHKSKAKEDDEMAQLQAWAES